MSSIPALGSLPQIPTNLDLTTISDDALLPAELERIIVELAAYSYPQTWLALLYVCHRFHQWVEPHLYTRISITPTNLACFLQHPLKHQRTRALLRERCESLCVSEGVDYFDSLPVLYALSSSSRGPSNGNRNVLKELSYLATKPSPGPLCTAQKELPFPFPQIIQLAPSHAPPSTSSPNLHTNPSPSPEASHPAPSPLERLSISVQSGVFPSSGNSFALPSSLQYSLANLTHLEILLPAVSSPRALPTRPTHPSYPTQPGSPIHVGRNRLLFTGYHHLPALTHLAINSWGSIRDVMRILKGCDRGAEGGVTRMEDRHGLWSGGGGKEDNSRGYDAKDVRGGSGDEFVEGGGGGGGQSQRGLKVLVLIASSRAHATYTRELLLLFASSNSPPPSLSSQALGNGSAPHKSYPGVDPRVVVLLEDRGIEEQDEDRYREVEGEVCTDVDVTTTNEGRQKTWDRWVEAEEIIARREQVWEGVGMDSSYPWGMGGRNGRRVWRDGRECTDMGGGGAK